MAGLQSLPECAGGTVRRRSGWTRVFGRAGAPGQIGGRPVNLPLSLIVGLILCLGAGLAGGHVPLNEAEAAGNRALDEYFKGRVVSVNDGVVTLRYNFRKKDQAKDFEDRVPWPIPTRKGQGVKWFDEKLEVVGNAAARHIAEWTGNVTVKVTITPDHDQDIGGFLTPINGANDFATFTLVEKFFHAWDGKAGGSHGIIKFGAQWRERGSGNEFIGFRYVDTKPPKNPISAGKDIRFTFGIQKKKLVMSTPQVELKGKDRGKPLKKFFLGFYAIKGRALFDNIEITGKLNAAWLRAEKIDLRIADPDAAASGELDPQTKQLIKDHKAGKGSKATRKLIAMVGDIGIPRALRDKVIEALSTGPKKAARYLRDLLYAPELEVRTDAIGIVEALLGKTWGYKPKAKEASRSKAIQKMNGAFKENPSLLEG